MNDSIEDKILFSRIEDGYKVFLENQEKTHLNYGDWAERMVSQTERLVDRSGKIHKYNLANFRGREIFVTDQPVAHVKGVYFKNEIFYFLVRLINKVIGQRRGAQHMVFDQLKYVNKSAGLNLLANNPVSSVGNPLVLKEEKFKFTSRHLRHIYLLGLFNEYIKNELLPKSIFMDIGSSYGAFTSLLKKELSDSRHILVDSCGQLILAEYYLAKNFPNAKIAGFRDVSEAEIIDDKFLANYDFILIPTDLYQKIQNASIDVVTNFLSLSEMSREWFDCYINSKVFSSAKFFFTVNRYDAYPTFNNGINVIDYPFNRYTKILMRNCKFFEYYSKSFLFFFYKKEPYSSQFFEYIGKNLNAK